MSDIKSFRLSSGASTGLRGSATDLEKPFQTLNEQAPGRSPHRRKTKEKSHA